MEKPYNKAEEGLSQKELKRRHSSVREDFKRTRCPLCKHKKHDGRRCYVSLTQPGSGISASCECPGETALNQKATLDEIAMVGVHLQTAFYIACGKCQIRTVRFASHVGTIASILADEGWRGTSSKEGYVLCPACAIKENGK